MKHFIFTSILLSVITCKNNMQASGFISDSSFAKPDTFLTQKNNDTLTIAGTWNLIPALSSDTAAGKIPQLKFDLKTNRFSGNTGCNSMAGSFVIKQDALSFGENIISTKMACPGYNEKIFLDNLLKTNRYQIKNGVLQLMYNTTILSQWSRHVNTSATKQI